jgi:hypothetical protein
MKTTNLKQKTKSGFTFDSYGHTQSIVDKLNQLTEGLTAFDILLVINKNSCDGELVSFIEGFEEMRHNDALNTQFSIEPKDKVLDFIKTTLVNMHKTCTTDKYGQVGQHKFTPCIFGERIDEVEQYCKENKGVLTFATYGGSFGTYRAFRIDDKEISKSCDIALSTNPNCLSNINSY